MELNSKVRRRRTHAQVLNAACQTRFRETMRANGKTELRCYVDADLATRIAYHRHETGLSIGEIVATALRSREAVGAIIARRRNA